MCFNSTHLAYCKEFKIFFIKSDPNFGPMLISDKFRENSVGLLHKRGNST